MVSHKKPSQQELVDHHVSENAASDIDLEHFATLCVPSAITCLHPLDYTDVMMPAEDYSSHRVESHMLYCTWVVWTIW